MGELTGAAMLDRDGDEFRVEITSEGIFLTSSQEECTATVGPFDTSQIRALFGLARGEL